MSKPQVAKLRKVVERSARGVSAGIDKHVARARKSYEKIAPDALKDDAGKRLTAAIADVLHDARSWAHTAGAAGVLDELKVIATKAKVNLSAGGPPKREDVAEYVANCVAEATAKAQAAAEGGWEQAFTDTFYRAEVLIEDQVVREYERGRAAAYDSLAKLKDDPKRGFVVAKDDKQARADGPVVVLVKRRSEINDARTCSICKDQDGQLRILGRDFEQPIPAHPRCRGISHLWAVGWPWTKGQKAMSDATARLEVGANVIDPDWSTRVDETVDGVSKGAIDTRHYATLDTRAIEVDEENRIIRGCVFSDESIDSHDSIIKADGWDLSRFKKNPILLWAHKGSKSWDPARPQDVLGTVEARIDGKRLVGDLHFLEEGINEQADMVFRQMAAKVLRAFSVGFRGKEWHWEKMTGGEVLIIDKAILVEVSVLPLGSNENALAREFRAASGSEAPQPEGKSTAAVPQEERSMTTEKTQENAAPTVALSPELASKMGVASIDAAVRAWEDKASQVSELELKLDKATKATEAAEERAVKAETALNERVEKDTAAEVDALIRSGQISEDKRDAALSLARRDIDSFRALYPKVEATPPLDHLTREVVKPDAKLDAPAKTEVDGNPVVLRAEALMKEGMSHAMAWDRAVKEHRAAS